MQHSHAVQRQQYSTPVCSVNPASPLPSMEALVRLVHPRGVNNLALVWYTDVRDWREDHASR